MRQLKSMAIRLVKFGTVGLVALAIQVGLFWTLFAEAHLAPLLAGALAAIIAMFVNFLLSSYYTWGDRRPLTTRSPLWRMGRYYLVIGIGYAIYLAVFQGLLLLGVRPFLGNLLGALASGGSNFLIHSAWTFRAS